MRIARREDFEKQIINKVSDSLTPQLKVKKKRVILISQPFYPDQQATSQLLSALAQALSGTEAGHEGAELEVLALCAQPSNARGLKENLANKEHWGGIEIHRGGLAIDAKRSLLHRAISYGSYLIWLAWRLLFMVKPNDRILVVTNPPFAPLIVSFSKLIRAVFGSHLKYTVILHDLYPDGLIALEKLKDTWWVRIWRSLNRYALHRAETVITLGRDMSDYLALNYKLPRDHLQVITNWSPVNFGHNFSKPPHETQLSALLPNHVLENDHLLIQYSGNMGLWHNMNGIVDAAASLQEQPIHFIMIGDGRRRAEAVKRAEALKLQNMTWLPFQPLDTLQDSLSCSHLSLVSQRDRLLGIMVPSKFYGILASGRGVIAQVPQGSEVALTIDESQCGIVLSDDSSETLAQCLRELVKDRTRVLQMGLAASETYKTRFSFESAVASFRQHLTNKDRED